MFKTFNLISFIRGPLQTWSCGDTQIKTLYDAILWRFGSLPGLDADIQDGKVRLWRLHSKWSRRIM